PSEAVKETRGAALRAGRRQIGAAADEAMWFIVEEVAASRWRYPARNPKGWWRLRAISASLVVHDATASPPPRSLISPRKLHQRGPSGFFHSLSG
ncbi:MAG: hypothetical protein ABR517_11380, partial [Thermoanaerobaculia bacterium]